MMMAAAAVVVVVVSRVTIMTASVTLMARLRRRGSRIDGGDYGDEHEHDGDDCDALELELWQSLRPARRMALYVSFSINLTRAALRVLLLLLRIRLHSLRQCVSSV